MLRIMVLCENVVNSLRSVHNKKWNKSISKIHKCQMMFALLKTNAKDVYLTVLNYKNKLKIQTRKPATKLTQTTSQKLKTHRRRFYEKLRNLYQITEKT